MNQPSSLTASLVTPFLSKDNSMADIIDSLKRLERVGSENSKTTEKLIQAASDLEDVILKAFAPKEIDRLFQINIDVNLPSKNFYYIEQSRVVSTLPGGKGALLPVCANREMALRFSRDVADGLLDQISVCLERTHKESESASLILEAATKAKAEKKALEEEQLRKAMGGRPQY